MYFSSIYTTFSSRICSLVFQRDSSRTEKNTLANHQHGMQHIVINKTYFQVFYFENNFIRFLFFFQTRTCFSLTPDVFLLGYQHTH